MNKKLLFALLTLAAGLVFEAGQARARQKDPDSLVDPAKAVTSTLLPAPDVTLGDEDTTAAGIADTVVGANDTTSGPPDPPSSGTTFWVDNTPLDGDCPQATFTTIQAAVTRQGRTIRSRSARAPTPSRCRSSDTSTTGSGSSR